MDENTQSNQQPKQFTSLISPGNPDELFRELGLSNLPQDKKDAMFQTMVTTVINRIFLRIEPSLTEMDLAAIESFEKLPNKDEAIVSYLTQKIPNLDAIATEEVVVYKDELKKQIGLIVDTMSDEMKKMPQEHHSSHHKPKHEE